jgi:succinate dehydrogenase / fumarate reductase cytochrome b subunit
LSVNERLVIKRRPVYLNLVQIRLPLPGFVSILHRISGVALFLIGIPLALYGLQESLVSAETYARLATAFAHPLAKLVLIGLLWSYLHHFCAGVRFLLLDLDVGGELKAARRSSVAVLVVSLALTAIIGARLW